MARKKVGFPRKTIASFEAGDWKVELARLGYTHGSIPFFVVVTMRGDGKRLRVTTFAKPEAAGAEFSHEKKRIVIEIAKAAMGLPSGPTPPSFTLGAGFFT